MNVAVDPTPFTPLAASVGGLLIGASAVVLMITLGRIAGVSGIFGAVIGTGGGGRGWSLAFLLGLIAGAAITHLLFPGLVEARTAYPRGLLLIAGLLVGFGTALGSGCTSGHGVCGLSRLSPRSLVAVAIFMAAGVGTATLLRGVLGT